MTNERGNPPSFTPGANRRPQPHDEDPVVVVGGPPSPSAPVRRPTPPPAPRVTARPGGSAQPIPPLRSSSPRPTAQPGLPAHGPAPRSARQAGTPPRGSAPRSAPQPGEPWADPPVAATRVDRLASGQPSRAALPGSSTTAGGVGPRRSTPATRSASGPPPVPGDVRPTNPGTEPGVPGRTRRVRLAVLLLVVLLVLALAWPVGLAVWANKKIQHTDALSSAAATPGTTYLLAGSDARGGDGIPQDGTQGARTDTILLLHVPQHGPTALISLPRDTYVTIDGHGPAKLNAAFAWGGAPLLVHTVEQLTGMKIDHYAEIGLGGVKDVVDAVGGVNLCYAHDVNDADSGMVWTAGCHDVNGTQALAYSRMRKADPEGDIGREKRQRQLISAVLGKLDVKSLVWHPSEQVKLIDAGTAALTLDRQANIRTLASLALAFRAANGQGGVTGTPPIKSIDYRAGAVGSTVLLDPAKAPAFWQQLRDGKLAAGTVGGIPG